MNNINIYHEDCLTGIANLPDESVDMVLTSPPYDNLRTYNGAIDQWNFDKFAKIASQLYRVLKTGGVVVWVVGDATIDGGETCSSFKQAIHFVECGFKLHDTMIYEKNSSSFPAARNSKRYTQIFEYMFVFVKGKIRDDIQLLCDKPNKWAGHTNWGNNTQYNADGSIKHTSKIKPVPSHSMRNNIWKYTTSFGGKTGHPAVFPLQLAIDHILSWTVEGDVVMDPFSGSGTTGVACVQLNRDFIGFEIDETYYNIAKVRIDEAKLLNGAE